MTLPRISTTLRSGRAASNCALRRVLLVAMVAPFGKSFNFVCGLKPRNSSCPGVQSADRRVHRARLDEFRIAIDQHVANVRALGGGGQFETGGQVGGQILQTVHRQVGLVV